MKAFVLLLAAILTSIACAEVSVDVYLADGETPLPPSDANEPHVYRDIMAGTRLVLVVSSDEGGLWYGGLITTHGDWEVGTLTARGEKSDANLPSYDDSVLENAGSTAVVRPYWTDLQVGFDLTAWFDAVPGEWFILDYHAEKAGMCSIGLYDRFGVNDILIDLLVFDHVPSRDFNQDTIVNFLDFSLLASQWQHIVGLDPNSPAPVDLDGDGYIGALDVALFSEYWLERTDCNDANDPNATCW